METQDASSASSNPKPFFLLLWLCRAARISMVGAEQLSEQGSILLLQGNHVTLFRAIYAQHLSERHGLLNLSAQAGTSRRELIHYLRSGYDALASVTVGDVDDAAAVANALNLARTASVLVFPVGICVSPRITLFGETRSALPLPWGRAVVFFEAPFKTAELSERIPQTWSKAILRLLERANTQAHDLLEDGKHQNPTPA